MSADNPTAQPRDYSIISPTARYVLLLKGLTDIPYAKETAELISLPETYDRDFSKKDFAYWARVVHFEARYMSIDQLLSGLPVKNILELSSGFSFRGFAAVQEKDLNYIDTDLPDVVRAKKEIMALFQNKDTELKGKLEIMLLNALDEKQFTEVASQFPPGELAIINEGLLMYLDVEEKKKLCKIIRKVLEQRGGYWITADIYIKREQIMPVLPVDDKLRDIFEKMHIRENMFESFAEAEAFFKNEGFGIDKEADPEYSKSSVLQYLLGSATEEQLKYISKSEKINAAWRLKPI